MFWQIAALAILLVFYGIYLGKMILQKKKGIQTDQIAKGKKRDKVYYTELALKIATYSIVLVELISIWMDISMLGSITRIVGLVLASVGTIIFGIAVWTMRDSWRAGIAENDKTKMVTDGIYKFSRNPAFLGFDLVYTGIVLMFFNPVLVIFSVFAIVMLHMQILQEERYLPTVFGREYDRYRSRVCRYFGRKIENR